MELAAEKRQLLTDQKNERAKVLARIENLNAAYQKELEYFLRQQRRKAFTQEITRARRAREEKTIWEYLNTIVERIHLFTWHKTVTTLCTEKYHRKRLSLEEELQDQDAQHRKARLALRYRPSFEIDHDPPNFEVERPRVTSL